MNTTGLFKYAGTVVALAICSACGGGSAVEPSNAALNGGYTGETASVNGMLVTAARPNLSAPPRYATILPDMHTKSKKFEYVGNFYYGDIGIFDYPQSTQQIGTIYNAGGAECANALDGYGKKYFLIVEGSM